MRVEIQYFKPTGKYYATGEYETNKQFTWEVSEELRGMFARGIYPGLAGACPWFHAYVRTPDYEHDVPFLITASQPS